MENVASKPAAALEAPPESEPAESASAAVPAPSGRKPLLPMWLRVAITATLLILLAQWVNPRDLVSRIGHARWELIALLLLLEMFQRVFSVYRWYVLVRCTNQTVRFWSTLRVCFVANFVGQFLPGIVGMETLRVVGLARSSSDLATSFSSVLVDRMLGLLALVLLVFVGLAAARFVLPSEQALDPRISTVAGIALGVLVLSALVMLHPLSRRMIERLMPPILARRIEDKLQKFYRCLDEYKGRPLVMAWALVLAIVFQVSRVALYVVAGMALRLESVPIPYFFIFVPPVLFIGMLPISMGGLGVREMGFVPLFHSQGMSEAGALALSLLVYVCTLASTLPGAFLYAQGERPRREGLGPRA